jgi:hypothetical protein
MGELFDRTCRYFQDRAIPHALHEDLPIVRVDYEGANGTWVLYARAEEEEQALVVLSEWPERVPEHRRLAMAEFLTRANYGLTIGNFELDFADGEVRFKTSVDVEGTTLEYPMIHTLVTANLHTTDQYAPGIIAMMRDGSSAVEEVACIEAG